MKLLRCLAALAALVVLSGAGQPPPPARPQFSDAQKDALDKVSAYLNGIHTLKSNFLQLGPNGQLDQGEFLLERPGKLRFAYFPPNPLLIVATGGKFYVRNDKMKTMDRYNISDTPLGLLLGDNIDLKTNAAITGIDIRQDAVVVYARTSNNSQQGNIALSSPQLELRQWTVKDNQGATTMVALQQPMSGVALDESAFAPLAVPKSNY